MKSVFRYSASSAASCSNFMKKLLCEPLLHFLLLGAAIFMAYGFISKGGNDEPGKIVITQGQIDHLATGFAKTWQRPPTEQELTGLIRDHLREEVLCREAIAMGMDKDDTVIRRRLRQKMEFVSDDIAAQTEKTGIELGCQPIGLDLRVGAVGIRDGILFRAVAQQDHLHHRGMALGQRATEFE